MGTSKLRNTFKVLPFQLRPLVVRRDWHSFLFEFQTAECSNSINVKETLLGQAPPHKASEGEIMRAYDNIKAHINPELLQQHDLPIVHAGELKKENRTNKLYVWVRNTLIRHGSGDKEERDKTYYNYGTMTTSRVI